LLDNCRPDFIRPVPTINLTDDETRRGNSGDPTHRRGRQISPRSAPRSAARALGKFAAPQSQPRSRRPRRRPRATSARGDNGGGLASSSRPFRWLHPVDGEVRKGPSPVSRLPACPRTITGVAPLGHEWRLAEEARSKLDEASTVRPVDRLTTLGAKGDVLGRCPPQVLDDRTPASLARRRGSPLMAFHPCVVWMRFGRAARGAYFRDKRAKIPARHAINWCVRFKRLVAKLELHGVTDK
jgi:hypothetical protein